MSIVTPQATLCFLSRPIGHNGGTCEYFALSKNELEAQWGRVSPTQVDFFERWDLELLINRAWLMN
jgi:hypothetical protein